jgi:hypothetical protein
VDAPMNVGGREKRSPIGFAQGAAAFFAQPP